MSSINKVILVGRLGKDPEVRFTPGGQAVANFTLATSRKWKDKDGSAQEKTEWHRIAAWGKTGELCGEYLSKGSLAYIEGEIETRQYKGKDGIDRYVTEIKAQSVQFLSPKGEGQQRRQTPAAQPDMRAMGYDTVPERSDVSESDDLPF